MVTMFLFYFASLSQGMPLDKILKARDIQSLELNLKRYKKDFFLRTLCDKQKARSQVPTACYELSLPVDFLCLSLEVKDFSLQNLELSLKSPFLSSACRSHLNFKKKILLYRKKDLLLTK